MAGTCGATYLFERGAWILHFFLG